MTSLLLQIGLTNACLAILVAFGVLVALRWQRSPRLEALLWLVVLIRFVMPPLVPYLVEVAPTAQRGLDTATSVVADIPSPQPTIPPTSVAEPPSMPMMVPSQIPATERGAKSETPRPAPISALPAVVEPIPAIPSRWASAPRWAGDAVIWTWLVGAVITAGMLMATGFRFHQIVTSDLASEADADLRSVFREICSRMSVKRIPRLVLLNAEISPMIWSWFGRTTVLLPSGLARQLNCEQQSMVLAHELAHLCRHDHHVRWFEALVQSLYWWFPPVGWIRRKLHAAQERCCDEWVDRQFPERRVEYCETLLTAANWLTQARRSPIWASELGRGTSLKNRIQELLQQGWPEPITRRALTMWILVALALLCVSVRWIAAEGPKNAAKKSSGGLTLEIVVTDQQGRPIERGEIETDGTTSMEDFFSEKVPIQNGKAEVSLKSDRLNSVRFQVRSNGYLTYYKKYIRSPKEPFLKAERRYEFQLKPGIKIGGKVVDSAGKPIAKAKISIYSPGPDLIEKGFHGFDQKVSTNSDGRWEMSGAPRDAKKLILSVQDFADTGHPKFQTIAAADLAKLKALADVRTLALAQESSSGPPLSGVVVDPTGKPVADAMIFLGDEGRNFFMDYHKKLIPQTNSTGEFQASVGNAGEYPLTVFSLDWALKTVKVTVPQKAPVKIVLNKGRRVEFRTVDSKGEPIAGVRFYPLDSLKKLVAGDREPNYQQVLDFLGHRDLLNNRSDEHGLFVWENAPEETLSYQIFSPDYLALPWRDYDPAKSPYTLVFRHRIPIHATVVDAATGQPISSYKIYNGTHFKTNPRGLWSWNLEHSKNARPGQFDDALRTLDRVVQYRVQAEGYRPALSELFDAEKLPEAPIKIEFRLQKDGGYTGRVLTPDGKPAAGAKAYAKIKRQNEFEGLTVVDSKIDESKMTAAVTAGTSGQFALPPIGDPFVCFIAQESGYAQLQDVELFNTAEIRLKPWAKIEGELRIEGKPAANVGIRLNQQDYASHNSALPAVNHSKSVRTDGKGKYRFDRCVAGVWNETIAYDETRIRYQMAHTQILTVDLAPGQTLIQAAGENGTNLTGRIALPGDADPERSYASLVQWEHRSPAGVDASAPFNARRLLRTRQSVHFRDNGSFRLLNLDPGEHELDITVNLAGQSSSMAKYSKHVKITPEMFRGKTPRDAIDLGTITFDGKSP